MDRYTPDRIERFVSGPGPGAAPSQKLQMGADIPGKWWSVFRNRKLNELIASAIEHNPNLQAADAAIAVAFHTAEAQKGAFLPQLALGASASRNLASNNVSASSVVQTNTISNLTGITPLNANQPTSLNTPYGLFLSQLSVSYTLDIWGQNRRNVEALEAQTDQQRFMLEAAYLTLTGNLVTAAIQEATLRAQIDATRRVVTISRNLLNISQAALSKGQIAQGDVLVQEAALAQAEALLPPLEKALAQQRNLITALAGRYSFAEVEQTFTLDSLTLPESLPLTLPSQLVRQRPDVRGAEANMHAASAQIGVAIAARLPNITINGNRGFSAFDLAKLAVPGTGLYTIAGNLAQPLFDGFSLLNRQRATEASFQQAEAQYRLAILTSFQNVADALRALQVDGRAVKAAAYAEQTALRSLDVVQAQAKSGLVNQLVSLNAQQTYLNAGVVLAQARGARLADVAGLFIALGGSWRDKALENLPPDGAGQPTAAQIETVQQPVNASWLPSF